jgi:CNT family concentrative nucleoside transporter
MLSHVAQSLLGLATFVAIAYALSENRARAPWRAVALSVLAQVALALATLHVPPVRYALSWLSGGVGALKQASDDGARFMFGYLAGGPPPFDLANPDANFVVAFQVLPLVLVVSALSSLLFHVGALPRVISLFAAALQRTFKLSGPLGFSAAASVFLGIIESPLLVKPYLAKMTRSDLFALMTCGMSTIAGTVLVLYAQVVGEVLPDAVGHLLVASVVSVPAALALARIMIPPDPDDLADTSRYTHERGEGTAVEATLEGVTDGVSMVVHIAAIIIVLFAFVSLANQALALIPHAAGDPVTLQHLVSLPMRPLVWLTGIPWAESAQAADLMATKTILNEFVAYLTMAGLPEGALSPRSRLIMTYAMCGFANLGSLGILAGGLGAAAPERREEIVALATRALLAGTLATLMTGAVIGLIHP